VQKLNFEVPFST